MQIFLKLFIHDYEKAKNVLRIQWVNGDPQYVHSWNSIEFLSDTIDTYPREILTLKTPVPDSFDLLAFHAHAAKLSKILDCTVQAQELFFQNGRVTDTKLEFSSQEILAAIVDFRKIHLQFVINQNRI